MVTWQNYSNSFLLKCWIFWVRPVRPAKWDLKRVCSKNLHDFSRIFLIFQIFSMTSPGSPSLFPKKNQSSRFSRYLWALHKTGITEPSHYFAIIVRTIIWIVELETLGYFFVSWHMIWDILAQFPWIDQIPEHLVNMYTLIQRRPWHKNMVLPDVKCGPVGFGLHFMCPSTWSAVFGSIFPKFTCCPNTQKTGITQTSGKFCTWLRTD